MFRCGTGASMFLTFSRISAESHEKREADGGNQCRRHDRDQQNHLSSSVSALRNRGAFVCVQYRGRPLARLWKPSDQTDGTTTKWSARFFLKLLQRFGRRTPRRMLLPSPAAACALLSGTLAVNANGPATPSPQSYPKSSGDTPCGTSRSFPGGRRRPF